MNNNLKTEEGKQTYKQTGRVKTYQIQNEFYEQSKK